MNASQLIEEGQTLLRQHGLADWSVRVADIGQRLGLCDHRCNLITVGDYYLRHNPPEMVLDTLKHEVAHALTPGQGHNAIWRAQAVLLGAVPRACSKHGVVMPAGKYKATCPNCKVVHYKQRLHTTVGWFCKKCGKVDGPLFFVPTNAA